MIDSFLSIFFPKICYGCGEVGSYLCEFCRNKKIIIKNLRVCHVCKKKLHAHEFIHENCKEISFLDGVIVSLKYNKFIEHLIAEFKYEFVSDLKNLLSDFLIQGFRESKLSNKKFSVTFVPLTKNRERWRGYNQSEKLAEIFAKKRELKFESLLTRTKFQKSQVGLKRKERIENVKNSFELTKVPVCKRVLIVDDVMTTGATLEECAKVLKIAGTEKVYAIVLARG